MAKADGKHLGRPRVEYPENWEECYGRWKSGVISAREAMTLTGLKKDSFYRLVKKYEAEFKNTRRKWHERRQSGGKGQNPIGHGKVPGLF